MLSSDLCDYSDTYIVVKGRISVTGTNDLASSKEIKRDECFAKNKMNNEIEQFLSKYKHESNIHEHRKQ